MVIGREGDISFLPVFKIKIMETNISVIFATGWAIYLITWGILLLSFPKLKIQMLEFTQHSKYQIFMGLGAMMIGMLHVVFHNFWSFDYRGLITLFGWIMLIESAILIIVPGVLKLFYNMINSIYFPLWILSMFVIAFYLLIEGQSLNMLL